MNPRATSFASRHRVMLYALDVSPDTTSSMGIYHYTRNLIAAMAVEGDPGFDVVILANAVLAETFAGKSWPSWCTMTCVPGSHTKGLRRLFADHVLSRVWAGRVGADAVFFPKGWVSLWPGKQHRIVSTVHDTMFHHYRATYPGHHSALRLAYWHFMAKAGTRRSDRILTVSRFSREQILRFSNVSPDKITVIHEGPGIRLGSWTPNQTKRGFLVVGSLLPHKRCRETLHLLAAYLRDQTDEIPVRVTGLSAWPDGWAEPPRNLRIEFMGRLSEEQMRAEFLRAEVLVFLSDMEGFGMPLLEALGHGTAICYRAQHAALEIFGPGPGGWDGLDTRGFFTAMNEARSQVGSPSYRRFEVLSERTSWALSAREHLDIFAGVLPGFLASGSGPTPKRVLYAHNSADLYGASRSLMRLCAHLPASRYSLMVVLPEDGPLRPVLEELGVRVCIRPQMKVITRTIFRSIRLLPWLADWLPECFAFAAFLKREKIDLLHTNTGVICSTGLAARWAGIPHVWHIRDWFQEFGGLWPLYSRYILRNADKVLCVSRSIQDQFPPRAHVRTMHNGFDVTKYRPANVVMRAAAKTSLGFHEDDFVLGCVGRVKFHRKGQEHLLEAVRLLRNKGIPAKGLVAGGNPPGSPQETERMRNLAEVLGIAEHICFAGEREQVEGMYHAMDVFVLPSAQPEPFGGVVLEAMCHELPVVATRLGGSVEQVEEGVTGFLVPPEKGEAIADACARLYVYPALRSAMGRAGRERVQTCFPLEKHLDSIDLLYQELLKGSTP